MTIQLSVLAPAGLGITGRTTVGRHRAELWWVSAAWIARLGGEQDEAHFLDRPGDAEEPGGQALLRVPPRPHTLAGLPHRGSGRVGDCQPFGAARLARADNFGNRQGRGPIAHGTNGNVTEILIGPVTPLAAAVWS
jgi:hypothetical protein